MKNFREDASFGSHDKPLLVCRGLLTTYEKPTMNSKYEFIVATPAILIRAGELEKVVGHLDENAHLQVDAALRDRRRSVEAILSDMDVIVLDCNGLSGAGGLG
jgi:hypothetical protein